MGYWKTKVLPKIQKVFGKDATARKAAAAEASKSFDESKESINKEFDEKKAELQPKVIEIYEASTVELKSLIKEPKEAGLKKHSAKVQKFFDELVKIDFPGSKTISEATSKFGPVLVQEPVIYIFEKVSTLIPVTEDVEAPAPAETSREVTMEEVKPKDEAVETAEVVAEVAPPKEEPEKVAEVGEPPKVEAAAAAEPSKPAEVVEAPAAEAPKGEAPAADPPKP